MLVLAPSLQQVHVNTGNIVMNSHVSSHPASIITNSGLISSTPILISSIPPQLKFIWKTNLGHIISSVNISIYVFKLEFFINTTTILSYLNINISLRPQIYSHCLHFPIAYTHISLTVKHEIFLFVPMSCNEQPSNILFCHQVVLLNTFQRSFNQLETPLPFFRVKQVNDQETRFKII